MPLATPLTRIGDGARLGYARAVAHGSWAGVLLGRPWPVAALLLLVLVTLVRNGLDGDLVSVGVDALVAGAFAARLVVLVRRRRRPARGGARTGPSRSVGEWYA